MEQARDLFESVGSEGDFWISPLAVLLLKINQSIQNVSTVTGYVAVVAATSAASGFLNSSCSTK